MLVARVSVRAVVFSDAVSPIFIPRTFLALIFVEVFRFHCCLFSITTQR